MPRNFDPVDGDPFEPAPPKVAQWPVAPPPVTVTPNPPKPVPPKPVGAAQPAPGTAVPPPPPGAAPAPPAAAPPIGAAPPKPVGATTPAPGTAIPPPPPGANPVNPTGIAGTFGMPPPSTGTNENSPDIGNVLSAYSAGENEKMQDFATPDPNVAHPSDFISFGDFAGLNDEQMRGIADRAAGQSHDARSGAAGFLKAAEGEATADTPVEKTASYAKYLDAMKNSSDAAKTATTVTGNPYEDALRGVYRDAQKNRDYRDASYSAGLGKLGASQRNTYLATQKKLAAENEAKRVADEASAAKTADRASTATAVSDFADERRDRIGRKTGRTGERYPREGQ